MCVCVCVGGGGCGGGGGVLFKASIEMEGAQELCDSRGGRPGLPSLINLRFPWT